jgi:catechol 2,3-dioxygenase
MTTSGTAPVLPATLRLGPAHLTVTDLDRSVGFYQDSIGLKQHRRDGGVAALGAGGEDLLVLVEDPQARPAGRHAGLYHVALLYPSREELARAAQRIAATRTTITGASDHGISEAIYLDDPDGNGLELAADRPRATWGDLGDVQTIAPRPLDMADLLSLVEDQEPTRHVDPDMVVGHLHLHVADIDRGLRFYRDVVGFEPQLVIPPAAFVSAGGYHHHLGFNVWRGQGVPPVPPDAVGLRHWTVVIGDEALGALRGRLQAVGIAFEDRDGGVFVRDPDGNAALFI